VTCHPKKQRSDEPLCKIGLLITSVWVLSKSVFIEAKKKSGVTFESCNWELYQTKPRKYMYSTYPAYASASYA
jgi:hypothetical protein